MKKLTDRQEQVLDFFVWHSVSHYRPPSYREIGEHIGLSRVSAVHCHMQALFKKGYLEHTSIGNAAQMTELTRRRYGVLTFEQICEMRENLKSKVLDALEME